MTNVTSVKVTGMAIYGEETKVEARVSVMAPVVTTEDVLFATTEVLQDTIQAYIKVREKASGHPVTSIAEIKYMTGKPSIFVLQVEYNDGTSATTTYKLDSKSESVVYRPEVKVEGFPEVLCYKRAFIDAPHDAKPVAKEFPVTKEAPKQEVVQEETKTEEMNSMKELNPTLAQLLAQYSEEEQQAMIQNILAMNAQQEQAQEEVVVTSAVEPEPEQTVEPAPVVDTDAAPEWLKRAISKLTVLSKNAFVGFLVTEKVRSIHEEEKEEIQKLINELLANDDRWNKKTKPFIIKSKGWTDKEVNAAAQKAFELSLATRQKTAAATEWIGDAIVKAGEAVKNNADTVGKVVASPITGAAHMMSSKPQEKKQKPAKAEPQY